MAMPAKDGVKTNFLMEKTIAEELKEYCERTGRTKTKVIEIAVKEFLEKHRGEEL